MVETEWPARTGCAKRFGMSPRYQELRGGPAKRFDPPVNLGPPRAYSAAWDNAEPSRVIPTMPTGADLTESDFAPRARGWSCPATGRAHVMADW